MQRFLAVWQGCSQTIHVISLCLAFFVPAEAFSAQPDSSDREGVIVVSGTGYVSAVPDEVRFVVGIDAKAPTAQQAYDQVEAKMQQAVNVLKRLNVSDENVQAMNLTLTPVVDYKQRDRIIAHDARRDIVVKVSNMKTYAQAMQQLTEIDITRFQQVTLSSSRRQTLEMEALEKALDNAKQKARRLAQIAGRALGEVVEITESGTMPSPRAYSRGRSAVATVAESGGQGTISSGLIRVDAGVSVTYSLQ